MTQFRIESFQELEAYLRNWTSFQDEHVYDFNGIVALLAACLDNLRVHATDSDLDGINDCLTGNQRTILARIGERLGKDPEDET